MSHTAAIGSPTKVTAFTTSEKKKVAPHVHGKVVKARDGAKTHSSRLSSQGNRTLRGTAKKIACDRIYRQTVAIDRLVEDEDDVTSQLAAACSLLTDSAKHLSDMCNGKHTRKAISDLIAGFHRLSAELIAKGEFHQVADLCANFSAGLDDIIGVKRKF